MKSEDTVIDLTDMGNYSLKIAMTSILKQQAEISFKAGMEEEAKGGTNSLSYLKGVQDGEKIGIKTVVETLGLHENEMGFCEISNHVPYAQLKDWGL